MPRNLRAKPDALIEKIVGRQEDLLHIDMPDYFKSLYANKDANASREASDSGVSDFATADQNPSDSFDSDFGDSSEGSRGTETPARTARASFAIGRSKAEYVKKGFDVKTFRVDVEAETAEEIRRPTKRKEQITEGKTKHFLHELMPQSALLKRALANEKRILQEEAAAARFLPTSEAFDAPISPQPSDSYVVRCRRHSGEEREEVTFHFKDEKLISKIFPTAESALPPRPRLRKGLRWFHAQLPGRRRAEVLRRKEALDCIKRLVALLNSSAKTKD